MNEKRDRSLVIGVVVVAIVLVAAVGGYYALAPTIPQTTTGTAGTTVTTPQQTVEINQKGSDTLLVLAQRWAEEYMKTHPNAKIAVSGGGSGTGIAALINGQIDVADSSREIKQGEIEEAKAKGITPVEWRVALDGISAIVHPSNPTGELTIEQLGLIYRGNLTNWKQLGGPDIQIITYGRQSNSGTYVYWKEHILGNKDYRVDMQSLNGNSDIVDAVSKDKNAIGYVGIAYAESRRSEVKILAVKKDAGSPAVMPTQSTILDGSYPISRYLYVYTNGIPTGEINQYLKWILGPQGQDIVSVVEYIPIPGFVSEEQIQMLG
jgi:phosphate transport system substrate-binding protein